MLHSQLWTSKAGVSPFALATLCALSHMTKTALAATVVGGADHVIVLSDSTARVDQTNGPGYGPDDRSDLWPNSLAKLLSQTYSRRIGGTGLLAVEGNAAGYDTDHWRISGPFQFNSLIGPYQGQVERGGAMPANGATVTLKAGTTALLLPNEGRTLWIYWAQCPDSVPFTVGVDDGARHRVSKERSKTCVPQRTQVFSGQLGRHTATITATGGDVYLYGAEWTFDQGGLELDNMAVGGATTIFYNSPAKLSYLRTVPRLKIAIVALGINDFAHEVPPEVYRANLEGIVDEIHRQAPTASVVIVSQYRILGDDHKNGLALLQSAYWKVAQQVAFEKRLTYISLPDAWGSFQSMGKHGYLTSDLVHPSDKGGKAIAAVMGPVLIAKHLLR